jgi:hypothetical protein
MGIERKLLCIKLDENEQRRRSEWNIECVLSSAVVDDDDDEEEGEE